MIIQTRYRDISWEEASACIVAPQVETRQWWEGRRGQAMQIEAPPAANIRPERWKCTGPWFDVVGEVHCIHGGVFAVCPHMAEIGD